MSFADVTSANVVGYQTVTIPAQKQTMIGIQFQGIGGESISVQDLFPDPLGQGFSGATAVSQVANADQLSYWDPAENGKYVYLYLNSTTSTSAQNKPRRNKWCVRNTDLSAAATEFWGAYNTASTAKLQPGMGLWLNRANYANELTVTMAGQVTVAKSGLSIALREGQTMFTCGFTQPFAPNPDVAYEDESMQIDWLAKGVAGATAISQVANADQLSYWEPTENGKYIYLYMNSTTSTSAQNKPRRNHWCVRNTDLSAAATEKWGEYNTASKVVIPAGRGVWYNRVKGKGALVLTLDQPYTLD